MITPLSFCFRCLCDFPFQSHFHWGATSRAQELKEGGALKQRAVGQGSAVMVDGLSDRFTVLLPHADPASVVSAVRTHRPVRTSAGGGADWVRGCADLARSKDAGERWKGVKLLEQAFADCSKESMAQVQVASIGVLISLLHPGEPPGIRSSACQALTELHAAVARIPSQSGGNKDAAILLGRFIPEVIKICYAGSAEGNVGADTEATRSALGAARRCTTAHPAAMRPYCLQLIGASLRLLSHPDAGVRRDASMALSVLPAAAPKDASLVEGGKPTGPLWQTLVSGLVQACSCLLWHVDGIRPDGSSSPSPGVEGVSPSDLRQVATLPGGSKEGKQPGERFRLAVSLADRFGGLVGALGRLLHGGGGYAGEGTVPTLSIVQIIERVLVLTESGLLKASFKHESGVIPEMLALVVARMQADAFALLKCLLRRTRLHSVCFMSVISQLVLSALPSKRSAGCDLRTVAALEAAGECMVQWGSSGQGILLKKLVAFLSSLLVGYAANVSGEGATAQAAVEGGGGSSQKRRRTAKNWQSGGAAGDGGGGGAAADSTERGNIQEAVLIAAVEAVDVGMCCGGSMMSPSDRDAAAEQLLRALLSVYNSPPTSPGMVGELACHLRLAMLKAMWTFLEVASPSQPSSLAGALRVFKAASDDSYHEVSMYAKRVLNVSASLLQPRGPTVFRPTAPMRPPLDPLPEKDANHKEKEKAGDETNKAAAGGSKDSEKRAKQEWALEMAQEREQMQRERAQHEATLRQREQEVRQREAAVREREAAVQKQPLQGVLQQQSFSSATDMQIDSGAGASSSSAVASTLAEASAAASLSLNAAAASASASASASAALGESSSGGGLSQQQAAAASAGTGAAVGPLVGLDAGKKKNEAGDGDGDGDDDDDDDGGELVLCTPDESEDDEEEGGE